MNASYRQHPSPEDVNEKCFSAILTVRANKKYTYELFDVTKPCLYAQKVVLYEYGFLNGSDLLYFPPDRKSLKTTFFFDLYKLFLLNIT